MFITNFKSFVISWKAGLYIRRVRHKIELYLGNLVEFSSGYEVSTELRNEIASIWAILVMVHFYKSHAPTHHENPQHH